MTTATAVESVDLPEIIDTTVIGSPPPAPPTRPRLLIFGTSLVTAAIVAGFGVAMGLYVSERQRVLGSGESWLPDGVHIPLTPGNMAMGTLALSGWMLAWGIYSVAKDDRTRAFLALGLTLLLGAAYVNEIAFYYSQVQAPLRTNFGVLWYAITGGHIAMVLGGLLFLGVTTFRTLGGKYSSRDNEGLIAVAIYWYASIAVLAVIWWAVFITK